jgi:hypothetical protein
MHSKNLAASSSTVSIMHTGILQIPDAFIHIFQPCSAHTGACHQWRPGILPCQTQTCIDWILIAWI